MTSSFARSMDADSPRTAKAPPARHHVGAVAACVLWRWQRSANAGDPAQARCDATGRARACCSKPPLPASLPGCWRRYRHRVAAVGKAYSSRCRQVQQCAQLCWWACASLPRGVGRRWPRNIRCSQCLWPCYAPSQPLSVPAQHFSIENRASEAIAQQLQLTVCEKCLEKSS